ncbi:hypothetical protein FC83_GL003218 [Agrilactobacillus composti DSM 18527 = JCM 14202]|uniref:Integral membrane protein n=1 Tax=Agrilactobacillus composti DSM 18527 = JCM 14202 TaxID=1423734 RepID=X0PCR1_9LACO|nr:DUF3021 domain-containing protein [Agrilactobacillus composti]KRM33137.1 hypothetical protein FC83_GL003218 [Agrilactobacillus composti DSM 18527 = JCM 14202]GAF38499.1 hypothetical protein JCM14202_311 [Agrilactobacillus composti DSM 18527 = JCM 14202]
MRHFLKISGLGLTIGTVLGILNTTTPSFNGSHPLSLSLVPGFSRPLAAWGVSFLIWCLLGLMIVWPYVIFKIKGLSLGLRTGLHFSLVGGSWYLLGAVAGWYGLSLGSGLNFLVQFGLLYFTCWQAGRVVVRRRKGQACATNGSQA